MIKLKNHYFVLRHGETNWGHSDICYPFDNKTSVVLSEQGISQIKLVTKSLKKEKIDLIFCSDYLRTKQTAEIVAKALNLKIIADIRLGDTDIGDYYGTPKKEFYNEFPNPIQRFETKSPKNGESWNNVKKRLSAFLEEIEAKYLGKNILIVGHGDSLWLFDGLIQESTNQELIDIIFKKKEYIKKGELRKIN